MKGRIFVIGASLSGIDALTELVSKLPSIIFIAQHIGIPSCSLLLPPLIDCAANENGIMAQQRRHKAPSSPTSVRYFPVAIHWLPRPRQPKATLAALAYSWRNASMGLRRAA
ncbi:hypothetical protein [Mesorhizobium sp.]|uniref:hypothetical protein n=1 Tax=Mesorhizobium sp. TaxID=1871066 RepID=UPI0025E11B4E|nr:hypothetical protein [Mesorhizobium sp.]